MPTPAMGRLAGGALRVALWLVLAVLVLAPLAAILLGAAVPGLIGGSGDGNALSQSLWQAAGNSLLLGLSVAAIAAAAGLGLALAMERAPPPLAGLWEALLFVPFLSAPYLLGLAWSALALPGSLFSRPLGPLAPPLGHFVFSLGGIAFITATHLTPPVYAMLRGYLAGTGRRHELAARVHGIGPARTFLAVTLPRLAVPLAAGALLAFLAAVEEFGVPAILGPYTGLTVLTTAVQSDLDVWPVNLVDAARTATLLLLLGACAWALYRRFDRAGGLDHGSPTTPERRGWAGVGVILWALLTGALPVVVLVTLALLRAETGGLAWSNLTLAHFAAILRPGTGGGRALATSMALAAGAGALSLALAGAIAALERSGRRADRALDLAVTLLNALPGIVLAVALVLVWNAPWNPLPLYGRPTLLLVAYTTVLLPLALRYARIAAARVEPGFLAAARVHGVGTTARIVGIVLPLAAPPLIGGFAVAFAFGLREFVTSVLLQPPGVDTVSTFIFNEAEQGNGGNAMAMAVVSLAVSVAAVGLLRGLQRRPAVRPLKDIPAPPTKDISAVAEGSTHALPDLAG